MLQKGIQNSNIDRQANRNELRCTSCHAWQIETRHRIKEKRKSTGPPEIIAVQCIRAARGSATRTRRRSSIFGRLFCLGPDINFALLLLTSKHALSRNTPSCFYGACGTVLCHFLYNIIAIAAVTINGVRGERHPKFYVFIYHLFSSLEKKQKTKQNKTRYIFFIQ